MICKETRVTRCAGSSGNPRHTLITDTFKHLMNHDFNTGWTIGIILAILVSISNGQVLINEFLASNVSVNADILDFDDYSDWLEIYNRQDSEIDLSGYFLTDDLNNPLKWKIPAGTTIEPHGYLLFWADGYDDYPGTVHTRLSWPFDGYITQRYHTNFKLSSLGEQIGLFRTNGNQHTTIIGRGSQWKYDDSGQSPESNWFEASFIDSRWQTGTAEFGYGDGDESTIISYGDDPGKKYPSTYFRINFNVNNSQEFQSLTLRMKRDDGAIVYLNGDEVARSNMPSGMVYFDTYAAEPVANASESTWFEWMLPSDVLLQGSNMCAVQVHQFTPASSDLSFDMELIGNNYAEIILIDSVSYKYQCPDISLGRNAHDNFEWYYYGNPTPGQPNTSSASPSADTSSSITFSLASGFYTVSQSLELNTELPHATIRYTTDGSKPTENSQVFDETIILNTSTIIQAQSYAPDRLPGLISTGSYFIGESVSNLPIVSLVVDPFTMWDEQYGIYVNNHKQREVPITFTYFEPEGEFGFKVNAGTRIGGMNIWRFPQKPLTIYMRGRYGNDIINYPLFDTKPIGMFGRIVLRNGGDNWTNAMLRDPMTEAILSGQVNNGFQAYKPCRVYLNDEYWGLYNLREKLDQTFFNTNFNIDPLSYDHLEYSYISTHVLGMSVVNGDADGYRSLLEYIESNNLADADTYAHVDSLMDIDSFIDYLIVEFYTVNTSWRHNREFWRPTGGKWQWLIPDLDRGYQLVNLRVNLIQIIKNRYSIFANLLDNLDFRNRLIQRYAAHIHSTFELDRLIAIVDSLSENMAGEMPYHIERWSDEGGIQSMDSWRNSIDDIKQFLGQRSSIALEQLGNEFDLNGTTQLIVNIDPQGSGNIYINDVPMLSNFRDGQFYKNIPFTLSAVPAVGYQFVEWEGLSNSPTLEMTLTENVAVTCKFIRSAGNIIPLDIATDTRLTNANSPYSSIGDIIIDPNVVLTVEEGVHIKMVSLGSIYVHGQLIIEGTEDNPVIIEPNYDTGADSWGAICFVDATDPSVISHTMITGATKGDDPINLKATISAYQSDITIDNVVIEDVEFPIFTQYGRTVIRNSTISTDVICDYINIKYGEGLVENCIFYGNRAPDTDAIDYDRIIEGVIRNNRIYNFRGVNSDGIDIGEESQDVLITGKSPV
ncbi:MAG: CotH kinase family protein [Candidatus Electryoneaceae bacterium]|nr:CotH kinase family protein [Candidatus Electryoneaceae bacterium]